MGIDLYYMPVSSPCRAVLLAAKNIGVDLNLKLINILAGDQMTPDFLAINPQHTIPTMDDDGFIMYESRSIIQYLANAYGKEETLYPTDPKARFLVDHRLTFDFGTLYKRFTETYFPVMFQGVQVNPDNSAKLDEALGYLEGFLGQSTYVAGDNITIADFSFAATLATIECVGHDLGAYPLVGEYLAKLKSQLEGYEELNQEGADQFGGVYQEAFDKLSE